MFQITASLQLGMHIKDESAYGSLMQGSVGRLFSIHEYDIHRKKMDYHPIVHPYKLILVICLFTVYCYCNLSSIVTGNEIITIIIPGECTGCNRHISNV